MSETMLHDEVVLPDQVPVLGLKRYRTAEHRLMLAVLCDAAYAYSTDEGKRRGLRLRREVQEWFASTDTSYVFSFESICDALGLDSSYIRRRVLPKRRPVGQPTAEAA